MDEKTIKIGNWDVPSDLFNEYVRFSIIAYNLLLKKVAVPSNTEYERQQRWLLCVQQLMKIHREICKVISVEYSEDSQDEFYNKFHKEVELKVEQSR